MPQDETLTGLREPRSLHCDHGLRRQTIVQSLLADVFQGRLKAGAHLVTQDLAERFGVSHTPIREALTTLAGMGVIDLVPNRGAVVRKVTAHEVREICQVRKALECEATRAACGRIDAEELQRLAADVRRMIVAKPRPIARYVARARAVDSRLHDLIADSCGNVFLAHELGRLKLLFRTFRDVSWERGIIQNQPHRLVEEAREHLAIIEALMSSNGREAARAMARHIRAGARYWARAVPGSSQNQNGKRQKESEVANGKH